MASPSPNDFVRYQISLTAKAESDTEAVVRWFCDQGAATAGERWLNSLLAKLKTLESLPERCSMAAEAAEMNLEVRELLLGRRGTHRILFQIKGETVHILRVWHCSRDALTHEDLFG